MEIKEGINAKKNYFQGTQSCRFNVFCIVFPLKDAKTIEVSAQSAELFSSLFFSDQGAITAGFNFGM